MGVVWVGRIFSVLFFSSNADGRLQIRDPLAPITSLLVMRPFFAYRAKKPPHKGVSRGCHYLNSLSVRLCVCVSVNVCVTVGVFTDCDSCTRPISTNLRSMEAGEYGRTRGMSSVTRCLEVVAVAGLMLVS